MDEYITLYLTGDAAYVAANHRTYLPLLLLAGMLCAVLVIFTLLFRLLKPYHNVQHKHHSDTNGDVVELVITNHNPDQENATPAVAAEVASL